MGVARLAHYSIRTSDLERSRRFYVEVLNLRVGYRPPFDFPGLWLYAGDDEAEFGLVHLIGVDPANPAALNRYLGDRTIHGSGSGGLDHIAFLASDWPSLRARCDARSLAYVQRTVPALGLHQVFLVDPSGLTIELNYPAGEAQAVAPDTASAK
ncbi:MAG TPA: VOC family protein [Caulobacteraceae bacterium]|jgi:catechol 2,3-dioxygenase-like lactoylglutathione lyase family enzyme